MSQSDFQLALYLQEQFEHEASIDNPSSNLCYAKKKSATTNSPVDPSWELIDPTPNIHILFVSFNEKYFWNKLLAVTVQWSKRMTSCAGICSYQGRGGLCKIALSAPLLKLRPRKDLVETLLHEMIHAYLFVTANNKDRDGHGPEFHKHMYRINADAGTNISVYHDFIDEVKHFQQHWWRCNGPCQYRKPYFGMVRRATNRAPGPNDRWWEEHSRTCNGTFIKVKEPEKPAAKTSKPSNTINKYFPILNEKTTNISIKTTVPLKTASNNNIKGFNEKTPTSNSNSLKHSSSASNIKGFKDLQNSTTSGACKNSNGTVVISKKPVKAPPSFKPVSTSTVTSTKKKDDDYERVRNHWINKYPSNVHTKTDDENTAKRFKPNLVDCPICHKKFEPDNINAHLDKCLETSPEKAADCDTQEFISCLVCDKRILKQDLIIHLDDCMGDDIFFNENLTTSESENDLKTGEIENKYNCPICSRKYAINEMSDHLNICLNNSNEFDEPF